MSNRALIAVPTAEQNGKYNVYLSRNGGSGFRLYPLLKELGRDHFDELHHLNNETPLMVDLFEKVEDKFEDAEIISIGSDESMVEEDPLATDIGLEDLINNIDYITYDVLYVVGDDEVDAYFLSWAAPYLHPFLGINTTLKVFPEIVDPLQAIPIMEGDEDPYYVFDGEAFLYPEQATKVRKDAPPVDEVVDVIAEDHMGLFRSMIAAESVEAEEGVEEFSMIGDLTLVANTHSKEITSILAHTKRAGVAIKMNLEGISPDVAWHHIFERANKLRWYHSMDVNKNLVENTEEFSEAEHVLKMTMGAKAFIDKNKAEFGSIKASAPIEAAADSVEPSSS